MPEKKTNLSFYQQNEETIHEVMSDFIPVLRSVKAKDGAEFAYKMARGTIDKALEKTDMMAKTSCSKSCSFCCHDTIFVTHDEGEYIKKVVKEKGIIPDAKRLRRQKNNATNIKWIDKACPLLSEENAQGERLCSIYEDRPLICRTHNSTEEPKFCDKSKYPGREINELKTVLMEGVVMSAIIAGQQPKKPDEHPMRALHDIL